MQRLLVFIIIVLSTTRGVSANQQPPVVGYMYPPGGLAGQTSEVTL
jgi:hypothetical protein